MHVLLITYKYTIAYAIQRDIPIEGGMKSTSLYLCCAVALVILHDFIDPVADHWAHNTTPVPTSCAIPPTKTAGSL